MSTGPAEVITLKGADAEAFMRSHLHEVWRDPADDSAGLVCPKHAAFWLHEPGGSAGGGDAVLRQIGQAEWTQRGDEAHRLEMARRGRSGLTVGWVALTLLGAWLFLGGLVGALHLSLGWADRTVPDAGLLLDVAGLVFGAAVLFLCVVLPLLPNSPVQRFGGDPAECRPTAPPRFARR